MSHAPIPRGSVIGILGNGPHGRMLAQAAREVGYRTWVLGPGINSPAGQVADREFDADFRDSSAIGEFAKGADVITFESEHIPVECLQMLAGHEALRPEPEILLLAQNRLRGKAWLRDRGFPVTDFVWVRSRAELEDALDLMGAPAMLKNCRTGRRGHGLVKIDAGDDLDQVWTHMRGDEAILEGWVDFGRELSVACARSVSGETRCFPVCQNTYHRHIPVLTRAPASIPPDVAQRAQALALQITQSSRAIGTVTVELFLLHDGDLLVNEITPAPHAAGHFSIDACSSSQFLHHILAITNRPLHKIEQKDPATTVSILGDLWLQPPPPFDAMRALPRAHLHLYGKADPSPLDEMGHITLLGEPAEEIRESLERLAFEQIFYPPKPPTPADIVEGRLAQSPFVPFTVVLSDGRSLLIDEPAALARLRGAFMHQSKEGSVTPFSPDDISAVR